MRIKVYKQEEYNSQSKKAKRKTKTTTKIKQKRTDGFCLITQKCHRSVLLMFYFRDFDYLSSISSLTFCVYTLFKHIREFINKSTK